MSVNLLFLLNFSILLKAVENNVVKFKWQIAYVATKKMHRTFQCLGRIHRIDLFVIIYISSLFDLKWVIKWHVVNIDRTSIVTTAHSLRLNIEKPLKNRLNSFRDLFVSPFNTKRLGESPMSQYSYS